jgi:hypothetical protein
MTARDFGARPAASDVVERLGALLAARGEPRTAPDVRYCIVKATAEEVIAALDADDAQLAANPGDQVPLAERKHLHWAPQVFDRVTGDAASTPFGVDASFERAMRTRSSRGGCVARPRPRRGARPSPPPISGGLIRRADLAAGRFDGVRAVVQTH